MSKKYKVTFNYGGTEGYVCVKKKTLFFYYKIAQFSIYVYGFDLAYSKAKEMARELNAHE